MLLTLAEVAARLQITEKAVRRRLERGGLADLRVVRVGRSVRVASEELEAWIGRRSEIGGARERALATLHISAPPYRIDPTRRHVSIILEHPRTHAPIRKRLVTPFACDESAALVWGRQAALDILEELMIGEREAANEPKQRAKPRDTPATLTLAELWSRYASERGARLRPQTRRVNETRWRTWIAPLMKDLPISEIGRPEITRLRSSLAHCSGHFANQVLGMLRRLLEFAVEQGKLADAPAIRSERCARKPACAVPDEQDLDHLLATAE